MKSSINTLLPVAIVLCCLSFLASCTLPKRGCDTPRLSVKFNVFNDSGRTVVAGKYQKGSNFSQLVENDTLDSVQVHYGYYEIREQFDWKFTFRPGVGEYTITGIRFENVEAGPDREDGCRDITYYTLNGKEKKVGTMFALSGVVPPVIIDL